MSSRGDTGNPLLRLEDWEDFVEARYPAPGEEPENLIVLPELVQRLPERERAIIRMRYVEELTQDEIAARMRISQMHVSRLLRRAIERMRHQLVDL